MQSARQMVGARTLLAAAVLLLILSPSAYLAWTSRDMPSLGRLHDDSIYWVCAKSLAQGTGYRILSLPSQPYQTKYPPLFPWLLSLIWKINPAFPQNLRWAAWLAWLLLPVYLLLARRLFSDFGLGCRHGWILCAVLAINPYLVLYSITLMSELLFSCLVMATLILSGDRGKSPAGRWKALLAGLAGGAAYLTRTSGVVLLLCIPLSYLLRKQRMRAIFFAAGMLPAIAWWSLWTRAHASPSTDIVELYYTNYVGFHLDNFSCRDLPVLLWKNSSGVFLGIGGLSLYGLGSSFWENGFRGLVTLVSIFGLVRLFRRTALPGHTVFLVSYTSVLVFWHIMPGDKHERLLVPIFPVLLAGLSLGLWSVLRWVRSILLRPTVLGLIPIGVLCAGAASLLWLFILSTVSVLYQIPQRSDQNRSDLSRGQQTYKWIVQNLPADATFVMPWKDAVTYLYTGRRGCIQIVPPRLIYYGDREGVLRWYGSFAEFMRARDLRYLVVHWWDLQPDSLESEGYLHFCRLVKDSRDVHPVYESALTSIYALER